MRQDELYHYGVLGMKWGQRRNRPLSTKQINRYRQKVIDNAKKASQYSKKSVDMVQQEGRDGSGAYERARKHEQKMKKYMDRLGKDGQDLTRTSHYQSANARLANAGKLYIEKTKQERVTDIATGLAISAGASFAMASAGVPLAVIYADTSRYRLRRQGETRHE